MKKQKKKLAGSPCSDLNAKVTYSILPAEAGSLLGLAEPEVLPPAEAPAPPLTVADVVDPPLPQVSSPSSSSPNGSTADTGAGPVTAPPGSSGQTNAASMSLSLLGILLISMFSVGC